MALLEVAQQVGEGLGGLFFDGFRRGLDGLGSGYGSGCDLGLGSGNRRGYWLNGGFSNGLNDRLGNRCGRDFFGGQGFGDIFFSHSGLLSILPRLGGRGGGAWITAGGFSVSRDETAPSMGRAGVMEIRRAWG